jgi:dinuclear metal center YbgI/SA1388 family protein
MEYNGWIQSLDTERLQHPKMNVSKILSLLESHAPIRTALPWDNVGLLLGNPKWPVSGVVLSIDLTGKALKTALAKKYSLILTHHPALFPKKGEVSKIIATHPEARSTVLLEAAQNKIAVASCHTNFDQCALEVINNLSKLLEIKPIGRLYELSGSSLLVKWVKLVAFVPKTHLEQVRTAICQAGAGQIGPYDFCTFSTHGEGTFRGNAESNPFIGRPGRLEKVQECRLETILPQTLQSQVIQALLETHPYEEVAYDLYPLTKEINPSSQGIAKGHGFGFWGDFSRPKSFSELLRSVRRIFVAKGFRVTDPPPARIKRIAFSAGQGESFIQSAVQAGCDLFITGEVGYHPALEGKRQGMGVLELGHRESEKFFLSVTQNWLTQAGVKSVQVDPPTQRVY